MGIVENLYNSLSSDVKYLIYLAIGIVGARFAFSKKFTQLMGALLALVIAVGFLQFPDLVKGFFESIFKAILPAQT